MWGSLSCWIWNPFNSDMNAYIAIGTDLFPVFLSLTTSIKQGNGTRDGPLSLRRTLRWLNCWLALTDWGWLPPPPSACCKQRSLQSKLHKFPKTSAPMRAVPVGGSATLPFVFAECLCEGMWASEDTLSWTVGYEVHSSNETPASLMRTWAVTREQLLCTKSSN